MSKILDIVLPTPCIICTKLGAPFCVNCKEVFPTSFTSIEVSNVNGFAITDYSPNAALIVNGIKEKGLTSLVPSVADLVIAHWPSELQAPVLVPLPSSPANIKKRGYSHTAYMAKSMRRKLPGATYRELIRSAGSRQDQVGLSNSQRFSNMHGAFKVDLRGYRPAQNPIVLVDDVLTSGASMAAAIEAMRAVGVNVAGFCVFARAGGK
jgi:predicted amidophosphoribosyltransferase